MKKWYLTSGAIAKEYREKKDLSQGDVASILGYKNGQLISNLERGIAPIPFKKLIPFCELIGCPREIMRDALFSEYVTKIRNKLGMDI